jgi:hypothetical protein
MRVNWLHNCDHSHLSSRLELQNVSLILTSLDQLSPPSMFFSSLSSSSIHLHTHSSFSCPEKHSQYQLSATVSCFQHHTKYTACRISLTLHPNSKESTIPTLQIRRIRCRHAKQVGGQRTWCWNRVKGTSSRNYRTDFSVLLIQTS